MRPPLTSVVLGIVWTSVGVVAFLLVRSWELGAMDLPFPVMVIGAVICLPVLAAIALVTLLGAPSPSLDELVFVATLCGVALASLVAAALAFITRAISAE